MGSINYYLPLSDSWGDLFMIIIWLGNIYMLIVMIKAAEY